MKVLFSSLLYKNGNGKVPKRGEDEFLVTLGAFNCYSSEGMFYTEEGLRDLMTEDSGYTSFASKLKRGEIKGETQHPIRQSGQTDAQFISRNLIVDNALYSHQILELFFEETSKSELPGTKVVLIKAWIKTSGNQHGAALKKDLEDSKSNVCFSIRCFSIVRNVNGVNHRFVTKIMTWDWVDTPGISYAMKDATAKSMLTRENADVEITGHLLDEIECENCQSITTESDSLRSLVNELRVDVDSNKNWYNAW